MLRKMALTRHPDFACKVSPLNVARLVQKNYFLIERPQFSRASKNFTQEMHGKPGT